MSVEVNEGGDRAEVEAFLKKIGEVVEKAARAEIEAFERRHLGCYDHVPTKSDRDVSRE